MAQSPTPGLGAPHAHPGRWDLDSVDRSGRFATRVTWKAADGTVAEWDSRSARRRGRIRLLDASGTSTGYVEAAPATARRMARANLVATTATTLGALLFALGALLAQADLGAGRGVDAVYLAGGALFSVGGYVALLQASNAPTDLDEDGSLSARRWRWFHAEPRQIGWVGAAVLFVGTLVFAVSLVGASVAGLTPREADTWVWFPDIVGCICFLVAGHLALVEVGHGWIWRIVADIGWWIVAVNQLGSIIFFLAGVASYTDPTTSAALNSGLANWGTLVGSVCFAVAGFLQLFERPSTRTSTPG